MYNASFKAQHSAARNKCSASVDGLLAACVPIHWLKHEKLLFTPWHLAAKYHLATAFAHAVWDAMSVDSAQHAHSRTLSRQSVWVAMSVDSAQHLRALSR